MVGREDLRLAIWREDLEVTRCDEELRLFDLDAVSSVVIKVIR